MSNIKSVSWKISIIVTTAVVVVGAIIAAYMQYRIVTEIGEVSRLSMKRELSYAAEEANLAFVDAVYSATALRNFAEANFDIDAYVADAESYMDSGIRPYMEGFAYNIINRSEFVSAAYFAVDPDLSGRPLVNEVYLEQDDSGISVAEPQTYEEYMEIDSEDMQWFYGAFKSRMPYWTRVYAWDDGVYMVSYVEPVVVDGRVVGVAGVDVTLEALSEMMGEMTFYDTGFAILVDNYSDFIETCDRGAALSPNDQIDILSAARSANDGFFEIALGGKRYVASVTRLANGYDMYALAPRNEYMAEVTASLIKFIIVFISVLSIVVVVGYFIGRSFGKPLVALIRFLGKASRTGDVMPDEEDKADIEKYSRQKDEIGQSINAVRAFLARISTVSKELEAVANGDLTVEITALSDQDILGNSLLYMNERLNDMFREIRLSSEQVSTGAKQIADGSQILALGSTEQTASVQELSSSISDIAQKTKENADIAEKAADLAGAIIGSAEKGNAQMAEMRTAVKEINDASKSIGKIIKAIDDIAFQTNILALNAAVEAARAGQHGKGFAVVAGEVRNLAAQSADAAKETGSMIQNSMEKASLGVKIADETHANFMEIATGINESGQLIGMIADSLDEQYTSISQINVGIDQVAQVTQQNSATAQEAAASSQEMNNQSTMLQGLVSQFRLKKWA